MGWGIWGPTYSSHKVFSCDDSLHISLVLSSLEYLHISCTLRLYIYTLVSLRWKSSPPRCVLIISFNLCCLFCVWFIIMWKYVIANDLRELIRCETKQQKRDSSKTPCVNWNTKRENRGLQYATTNPTGAAAYANIVTGPPRTLSIPSGRSDDDVIISIRIPNNATTRSGSGSPAGVQQWRYWRLCIFIYREMCVNDHVQKRDRMMWEVRMMVYHICESVRWFCV